jgi:hypothetical protein
MSNSDDPTLNRSGEITSSGDGAIEALPTGKISLGDIDDLHAYVRKIARPLAGDEQELEDLISEGLALACERQQSLSGGKSLRAALSYWLESRLRDYRRMQHREWRRNSRGGTSYTLPGPTGLAWEHADTSHGMAVIDETALIESRLVLQLFKRQSDFRDPRVMGRYLRVPSAAALATSKAADIWATAQEEQALTEPKPFRFRKPDDLA